jgi:very-short-patch-repair endonuclease
MELPTWLDDEVPLLDPTALPRIATRRDAHAHGHSDRVIARRVASRRWCRLLPGVYLTQPPPSASDRLFAAVLRGGPGAIASGAAALHAYGFRTVGTPQRELVLVRDGNGVRSFGRVTFRHTARLPSPILRPGPPLAPVERAVADHARSLRCLDDVRAVVAEAVQRGFCAIDAIAEELHAGRRNGGALLGRAVHEVTLGAASAPEARAASLLRAARVPAEQNAAVIVGARRYVADFLWRGLWAILEIDSRDYHFSPRDWQATRRRHAELETAGYSVIHVDPSELRDADDFLRRVRRWLTACRRAQRS